MFQELGIREYTLRSLEERILSGLLTHSRRYAYVPLARDSDASV
jgi:hypothetical protein